MPAPILIFSADALRGNIALKILRRNGFKALLFNRILEADRVVIAQHTPRLVIFDTDSCFLEEIDHLKNLCRTLEHTLVVVLGKSAVIGSFKGPCVGKDRCLSDPLDPDRILIKVKQIITRQTQKEHATVDTLENDLKQFLNLG